MVVISCRAWVAANKVSFDAPLSIQNTKNPKLLRAIGEMSFSRDRAVEISQQHSQIPIKGSKKYNQLSASSGPSSISSEMVNIDKNYSSTLPTSKALSSASVKKHQQLCELEVNPTNSSMHENRIGGPMTWSVIEEKPKKSNGSSANDVSKHEANKNKSTKFQQSTVGPRVTRSVSARIQSDVIKKRICTRSRSRTMSSLYCTFRLPILFFNHLKIN